MMRKRIYALPVIVGIVLLFLLLLIGSSLAGRAAGTPQVNQAFALSATSPAMQSTMDNMRLSITPMPTAAIQGGQANGEAALNDALPDTGGSSAPQREPAPQQERIVLRNASLTIVVGDPEARIEAIATMTAEMGGWVVSSSLNQIRLSNGDPGTQGTITARIPAERLAEALMRIKADVDEVATETVTGEDITQQYIDIGSRLANLEAAEAQLQDILERAETTEDVLNVFTELTRIRGDIESLRGQINYWNQAAAFSSLQVTVRPTQPEPVIQIAEGWHPGDTVRDAAQTLINIVQDLIDSAITLVIVAVPLLLLAGIPAWLIWRTLRRRALRKSAA